MFRGHQKKALFLVAHPRTNSFSHFFSCFLAQNFLSSWEIAWRDLYRPPFDPLLKEEDFSGPLSEDIKAEMDLLFGSNVLFVFHPVWWYGMPAVLKGWIDRVLREGFAFKKDSKTGQSEGLLQGKGLILIRTAGASSAHSHCCWEKPWEYCGFDVLLSETLFDMSAPISDQECTQKMHQLRNKIISQLSYFAPEASQ
ncbi:NAD(P)H-dependent oxidoreductase [Candidatus Similichlamydia laticola]|uniref:NAD(P)H oxidoreductase n=1 Tax=Candidatus Similichlamydia laticola TaxID=2170265 RepID=A0A369KF77_9BACT|nr:NAD(P)H-dependent oxidoreductase [Candidatus Similichlamydia laticola]RDB31547.1 NAD(P)H oxidoreductase [Candidatus Similichlamydia laticola]